MGNDTMENGRVPPFCIHLHSTAAWHGVFFFFFFCHGVAQTLGDTFVMTLGGKRKKYTTGRSVL